MVRTVGGENEETNRNREGGRSIFLKECLCELRCCVVVVVR